MSDDPRVDAIWESLAPHVEWARGFSLILLFASHPAPVEQLRTRLEASLRARDRVLCVIDPGSYPDASALTLAVLEPPTPECGALWIPLWWMAEDGTREFLLARLNERRFVLERDVTRPFVLVLPTDYRTKIALAAPDLWVVRSFSQQLPDPEVPWAQPRERAIATREVFVVQPPGAAELEWRRLVSAPNQSGLAIEDGLFAFQSARARGSLWDARRIAIEMLMLVVRGRVEGDALTDMDELLANAESLDSRARRNLAIAFDCLAEVEAYAGNLAVARELYGRSLEVSEARAKADPHDAQAQFDVADALHRLGRLAATAGNSKECRDHLERASAILDELDAKGQLRGYTERDAMRERVRSQLAALTAPAEPSA